MGDDAPGPPNATGRTQRRSRRLPGVPRPTRETAAARAALGPMGRHVALPGWRTGIATGPRCTCPLREGTSSSWRPDGRVPRSYVTAAEVRGRLPSRGLQNLSMDGAQRAVDGMGYD